MATPSRCEPRADPPCVPDLAACASRCGVTWGASNRGAVHSLCLRLCGGRCVLIGLSGHRQIGVGAACFFSDLGRCDCSVPTQATPARSPHSGAILTLRRCLILYGRPHAAVPCVLGPAASLSGRNSSSMCLLQGGGSLGSGSSPQELRCALLVSPLTAVRRAAVASLSRLLRGFYSRDRPQSGNTGFSSCAGSNVSGTRTVGVGQLRCRSKCFWGL